MKNFTNNFKQFTSRLSARWLIMALMMLLGTSSAWAGGGAGGPMGVYLGVNGNNTWYKINGVGKWGMTCSGYSFDNASDLPSSLGDITSGLSLEGLGVIGWTDSGSDWVAGKINYTITPGSKTGSYETGNFENPSWGNGGQVQCSSGNNRVTAVKSSVNLIDGLGVGDYTLKFEYFARMQWQNNNGNGYYDDNSGKARGTKSVAFIIPGYSTTSGSHSFGEVNLGSQITQTIDLTHYGSDNTATVSITGTNKSEFTAIVTENGDNKQTLTVTFKPTTVASNKAATITVTDDYNKTYTLTVTGTGSKSCETVAKEQYPMSPTTFTYNGSKQVPTITPAAGAGSVTSTVYKLNNTTTVANPTDAGTYTVYVTSSDGTTYCGASSLNIGTFTIDKKSVAKEQYSMSATTFTYNGNKQVPTITPASGAGAVTSTVYKLNNTTTVANPTDAGTYTVYVTSSAGTNYTAASSLNIGTFTINKKTVAKGQYSMSPTTFTYNGSKQVPTITPAAGAGSVTSTVYKLNNTTTIANPTDAGTYTVYVTSNAGTNYTAASSLNIGTFTINKKTVAKEQYSMSPTTFSYNGSKQVPTITPAAGAGAVTSTVYKLNNTTTVANPTDAGTYTVYVTSSAGTNYTAASNLNIGTFTINEVCEPIAGLYWEITSGKKDKYCPGDKVTVTMTYNGTTAKDHLWGGNYNGNIGISGGSRASGAVYTMTINKPGTVNLTLTGCDGETATTTTLEFTTHEAPATPTVSFSVNPVGQSKETILSIASYSADNNYIVYRSADNAVGNDTEVGAYTAPMSIRHNDTGSYYYYAKATNKSCANLTATSAIVKLDVQEAGAIIAALGDLKIDAQDPVDFVAMYVKNDGLADFSAQGATSVTGYTWQFSSDGVNNWSDCASTNVVDGVNYELGMENGSANCNNFRPNKAGTYRCVVKYNTGDTQNSNYLTVTADGSTAKTFKGVTMTLPVVSVNTGSSSFPVNNFGGTPSKNADKMKEKISVDVKIFENINGTTQVVYDRKARMNYRGSSSLNFLKKSYAFCPGDEICGDKKGIDYVKTKKLNMLGIGSAKDKDWVLYAAAADPSLMRNRLVFDTFADMTGGWSVSSRYVELVVNGEYKGVYVLMDKITANMGDKNVENDGRVEVEWKLDNQGNTTQEGFIVKFDKTDIVDRYENTSGDQKTFKSKYSGHDGFDTYDTNIDQRFEVEYPEKEDIEDGKGKWSEVFNAIENKINKFEEELAKGNFSEVQKLIDYTSWADWFIITEFAKNIDGYRASNLFVYDGSKPNAKIEARPLWDQELSFNNQCPNYYASYGANSEEGLIVENSEGFNNDASTPFWFTGKYKGDRGKYNGSDQTFKGLLDDPCFQAEVQARWEKHTGVGGALTSDKMVNMMKGYLADLDKDHVLDASTIHAGTPLDREFNTFWKNKSRATIDCGTGSKCFGDHTTGYTDPTFHNSKVSLNNWLTGNRRTNLGNIINGWEGTELNITLTITPGTGITTPWEAVMVQVNNPSGYDYDLEYTTNTLDKVSGVIINENNDKYTYRIPRPEAWKPGDEEKDGERTDIQYGIKATLKVGEGVAQCGNSSQAPSATTTITLQDEDNENCQKP